MDNGDSLNGRAKENLAGGEVLTTTDHVLVDTWRLTRSRLGWQAAERQWGVLRLSVAVESVRSADLDVAWEIGRTFADQDFSLVDRTSFAVMERRGVPRMARFDAHFAIYRYGPRRERAFEVLR